MNRFEESVIIACYNEERHIKHCIDSILDQSLPPDEVIVVDDGSTDASWSILVSLKKIHPKIKIYRRKHFEQATARNFGAAKSTGDILVFPDADYYFDHRFLELLTEPIKHGKEIATYTNDEYIANSDNIWSMCWNFNAYLPKDKRVPENSPVRANNFRAILRNVFIKAGGFSETGYSNDVTVLNKFGKKNAGFAVKGAICYHYNPSTLNKVFRAAFRKGSKGGISLTFSNILRFLPINSLRQGTIGVLKLRQTLYLVFKLVFDTGVLVGLCQRLLEGKTKYNWGASQ